MATSLLQTPTPYLRRKFIALTISALVSFQLYLLGKAVTAMGPAETTSTHTRTDGDVVSLNSPGEASIVNKSDTHFSTKIPSSTSQKIRNVETGWWTPYLNSTAQNFVRPSKENSSSSYDWCIPVPLSQTEAISGFEEKDTETNTIRGLVYIKSHKASSTTGEGVNIAIARRLGDRLYNDDRYNTDSTNSSKTMCQHWNRHEFADEKMHAYRTRPYRLWSFVRHPRQRDVSQLFHFLVGRQGVAWNDTARLVVGLQRNRNRQTRYLSTSFHGHDALDPFKPPNRAMNRKGLHTVRRILKEFDFLGVTGRMTESLAVLTLLWRLKASDVIVLSAKRSSGTSTKSFDAGGKINRCTELKQYNHTPGLDAFLHSESNYMQGNADFLLYHAAELSLDWTIEILGVDVVKHRAEEIRQLQELVQRECRPSAIFPCSANGTLQIELAKNNCYVQDSGCGYPCVDRVLQSVQHNH